MRYRDYPAVLAVLFTTTVTATAITIDDFEGYADTAALRGTWTLFEGLGERFLETTVVDAGAQSMRLEPTYVAFPFSVFRLTLPSAEDWSAATSVSLRYRGEGSTADHDLTIQVLSGGNVVKQTNALDVTQFPVWQTLTLPLAGENALTNVTAIQLAVFSFDFSATPVIYIDEITRNEPVQSADLIVSAGTGLAVAEAGSTDSVTVSLDSQPGQSVTVTPVYAAADLLIAPPSRTITPSEWQTGKTFTVSAVEDNLIEGPHSETVGILSSSPDAAYDNLVTTNLTVEIADNDVLIEPEFTSIEYIDALGEWLTPVMTYDNQIYWLEGSSDPGLTNWSTYAGPFPGLNGQANLYVSQPPASLNLRVRTRPNLP